MDEEPLRRLPEIERLLAGSAPALPERARSTARQVSRSMKALVGAKRPAPSPVSAPALAPGSLVADRYEVMGELGRGGVATVYRARDRKFGVDVALKVASFTGEAFADFQARFRREARIGFLLGQEPGVVRAVDWGELEPGRALYLALDLIEDPHPLDLRRGPLSDRLLRLKVAAGLVERVHRRGVVHRDLKPGNFLVDQAGRIRLSDFGAARPLGEAGPASLEDALRTQTGTLIGTPLFMAPEQFAQPAHVDRRADVYALGVMLFFCLTGRYPYEGQSALQVISRQMAVRYAGAPRPELPKAVAEEAGAALAGLCSSSIDQDPSVRPASAGAFRAALESSTGAQPALTASRRLAAIRPRLDPVRVREQLGVDAEGFVGWEALRALWRGMGPASFLDLLARTPALVAVSERVHQGTKRYEGRAALLLPRRGGEEVALGRTTETDLTVNLVTISKLHLRFKRSPAGTWSVSETGSVNGSSLGGTPLRAGEEHTLREGDRICLAQHLTLLYLTSSRLSAALEHGSWEALA